MPRLLFILATILLTTPTLGQHMISDINSRPVGIRPTSLKPYANGFVFQAEVPETGRTLWTSDGTSQGTFSAVDLVEGAADMRIDHLNAWDDGFVFWESNTDGMYVSDGTQAGTRALTGFWNTGRPREVVPTDEAVFFTLSSTRPYELRFTLPGADVTWKVDYTCSDDACALYDATVFRDSLYFVVRDQSEYAIWRVGKDGRDQELVGGPFDTSLGIEGIVGDRLLIDHRNDIGQYIVSSWAQEEGLTPLYTLAEPNSGLDFYIFGQVHGSVLMHLSRYDDYPANRTIATDGTPDGTRVILENAVQQWPGWERATLPDGRLVFNSWSEASGSELWISDGTSEGTGILYEIPGAADLDPVNFALLEGELYFCGNDLQKGEELWKTDGTTAGTVMVADIEPGAGSGLPGWLIVSENRLFFRARTPELGYQIMQFHPSTSLVSPITGANVNRSYGSGSRDFVAIDGQSIFSAYGPSLDKRSLWMTDGSAPPERLNNVAGVADHEIHGTYLGSVGDRFIWRDDTKLIVLDRSMDTWSSVPITSGWKYSNEGVVVTEDGIAFGPVMVDHRTGEVWITDGTEAGTSRLYAPPEGNRAAPVAHLDGKWLLAEEGKLFSLHEGQPTILAENAELTWKTRSTHAGDALYVYVENIDGLWVSDGTVSGTHRLNNTANLSAGYAIIDGDLVYVDRISGTSGVELTRRSHPDSAWVVRDIYEGPYNSWPLTIHQWNDRALFTAKADGSTRQVWVSDGSEQGTQLLISDLGEAGRDDWESRLFLLGSDHQRALFSVGHGDFGREPWFTDGTAAGTHLLADINPGPAGSDVTHGGRVGDTVLFGAHTDEHGNELWGVSLTYLASNTEETTSPHSSTLLGAGYPNPASTSITFPFEAGQAVGMDVHVVDILGRRHRLPADHQQGRLILDVNRLSPGVYFLQIRTADSMASMQFVKGR